MTYACSMPRETARLLRTFPRAAYCVLLHLIQRNVTCPPSAPSVMPPASVPPPPADAAVASDQRASDNWNDLPTGLDRSPHPYRRAKRSAKPKPASGLAASYLPSPALTPYQSDSESRRPSLTHELNDSYQPSPCESGTEADDETLAFTKALPAPPIRPRKGLRNVDSVDDEDSSIGGLRHKLSLLGPGSTSSSTSSLLPSSRKQRSARHDPEATRRVVEFASLLGMVALGLSTAVSLTGGASWQNGLRALVLSYCAVLIPALGAGLVQTVRHWSRAGLPSTFDPAPVLYPPLIPFAVAASLSFVYTRSCLPNVILSLSSLPAQLIPKVYGAPGLNSIHWLLSLAPLILDRTGVVSLGIFGSGWSPDHRPNLGTSSEELMVLLFPLHESLVQPLKFLTSSSLLQSELQLLSIALLNVLLLAQSPQMVIWKHLIWTGGFGTLVLCCQILRWNVALERIPVWRFKRAGNVVRASQTFLNTLSEGLRSSDSDKAMDDNQSSAIDFARTRRPSQGGSTKANGHAEPASPSAHDADGEGKAPISAKPKRMRDRASSMHAYLSMTYKGALARKVAYTAFTYAVVFGLILGPIRASIGTDALQNAEPFGWAIGYLFGNLPAIQWMVDELGLRQWVPLMPPGVDRTASPWIDSFRYGSIGAGNTRLLIFAYFASVLGAGIGLVLHLSTSVEVDTRRKVFHGTMVLLLIPTAFIDPAFLSLGLVLVLTVFLLLEVIRAAQLRPLSRLLAQFLEPYVDGRDLRGPVVVSHLFLLIGCAIPFWLSMAGIPHLQAERPWKGWEPESRDVSMVAGVICVGLGDAAASLVGRRYGRHKWPWQGGKSIEGSAAFATAVALGLLASKAWLRVGGWRQTWTDDGRWMATAGKALVAGAGSSLTEAVLTGCNDNVVVPVLLWLLVRGLVV